MNRLAKVNVVLPVYNPPDKWAELSLASCHYIREKAPLFDWQFHFVNDGSPCPKAFDTLRQQKVRYIHLPEYAENQGKGFAIRHGFQQAGRANFYMHSDWDFPFGEQLLMQATKELQSTDIVLANRGSDYYVYLPRLRRIITGSHRLFNTHILQLAETDTQAGFKAFSTEGYHIFKKTQINEFLFDTEFIAMAQNVGLKMRSLDVVCRPNLLFKNFSSAVLSQELRHLPKIFKARYVQKHSLALDYRLRRV
jgi:glycosyltransferase involved in cell wall biosynthesis